MRKWWKVLSTLLMLLKLCLIRSVSYIGALTEDCLQPLAKLLHLASSTRPRAGRLRDIYMSMRAPRSLSSCSWLDLLNFIDGVYPILQKIKSSYPLNHEHEVRGIGQLPPPILHYKSQLSPHESRDIEHVLT